ncbi:MAG TPA: hypothetical protein VNC11_09810 [Gemmatimonadaceae bacterium]|nr:hypothetical protein [Gemmatimonadaceae bacterium]
MDHESSRLITLPYEFDTARITRMIVTGMIAFDLVVVIPGIAYSLLVTHDTAAVVLLFIIGCMTAFFGFIIANYLKGSSGTITARDVVLSPARVFGLKIPGPTGHFPIDRFRAVRVETSPGRSDPDAPTGPYDRIYLAGKDGTPDILIARTDRHDPIYGMAAGEELARLLDLPCEPKPVAY